jgi:hypothetical protein
MRPSSGNATVEGLAGAFRVFGFGSCVVLREQIHPFVVPAHRRIESFFQARLEKACASIFEHGD